jgi:hypothetical protein
VVDWTTLLEPLSRLTVQPERPGSLALKVPLSLTSSNTSPLTETVWNSPKSRLSIVWSRPAVTGMPPEDGTVAS